MTTDHSKREKNSCLGRKDGRYTGFMREVVQELRTADHKPSSDPDGGSFYLSGEDPRFYKRRVKQYPASLSGGFQSPTEINAPRGCAGIRLGIMSAYADPNLAPSLASET